MTDGTVLPAAAPGRRCLGSCARPRWSTRRRRAAPPGRRRRRWAARGCRAVPGGSAGSPQLGSIGGTLAMLGSCSSSVARCHHYVPVPHARSVHEHDSHRHLPSASSGPGRTVDVAVVTRKNGRWGRDNDRSRRSGNGCSTPALMTLSRTASRSARTAHRRRPRRPGADLRLRHRDTPLCAVLAARQRQVPASRELLAVRAGEPYTATLPPPWCTIDRPDRPAVPASLRRPCARPPAAAAVARFPARQRPPTGSLRSRKACAASAARSSGTGARRHPGPLMDLDATGDIGRRPGVPRLPRHHPR